MEMLHHSVLVFSFLKRSIVSSHVFNAFPYASNFSGSDSVFSAVLVCWILVSRVCSALSRIWSVTSLFSSSMFLIITTGLLHFAQNVSLPFLNRGVPHCGHVSWSIVAPDLRSSDIRFTSVPTTFTYTRKCLQPYYFVGVSWWDAKDFT